MQHDCRMMSKTFEGADTLQLPADAIQLRIAHQHMQML